MRTTRLTMRGSRFTHESGVALNLESIEVVGSEGSSTGKEGGGQLRGGCGIVGRKNSTRLGDDDNIRDEFLDQGAGMGGENNNMLGQHSAEVATLLLG